MWWLCPSSACWHTLSNSLDRPEEPFLYKYRLRFRFAVRRRGKKQRGGWKEKKKKWWHRERERGEWYGGRGWGDFCGWGNKKGNGVEWSGESDLPTLEFPDKEKTAVVLRWKRWRGLFVRRWSSPSNVFTSWSIVKWSWWSSRIPLFGEELST